MACPKDGGSYILVCSICGRLADKQAYGELVARYKTLRKLVENFIEVDDEIDELKKEAQELLSEPP